IANARATIDFGDVMMEHNYDDMQAYAQSKLAQVMFTFDLARELKGTGVFVSAVHPSTSMNTHMVLSRGAQPRTAKEDGVEAVLHLVNSPNLESGQFFDVLK